MGSSEHWKGTPNFFWEVFSQFQLELTQEPIGAHVGRGVGGTFLAGPPVGYLKPCQDVPGARYSPQPSGD